MKAVLRTTLQLFGKICYVSMISLIELELGFKLIASSLADFHVNISLTNLTTE